VSHTDANKKINVIPSECPCGECDTPIPTMPSGDLLKMFENLAALIKEHGEDSLEVFRYSVEVHIELDATRDKTRLLNLANRSQWPLKIDFKTLPDRILAMESKLTELVLREGMAGAGPVQDALRDRIARLGLGADFSKFAKLNHTQVPDMIRQNSRPG
jgi:hypothetical protein